MLEQRPCEHHVYTHAGVWCLRHCMCLCVCVLGRSRHLVHTCVGMHEVLYVLVCVLGRSRHSAVSLEVRERPCRERLEGQPQLWQHSSQGSGAPAQPPSTEGHSADALRGPCQTPTPGCQPGFSLDPGKDIHSSLANNTNWMIWTRSQGLSVNRWDDWYQHSLLSWTSRSLCWKQSLHFLVVFSFFWFERQRGREIRKRQTFPLVYSPELYKNQDLMLWTRNPHRPSM